MIKKVKYFGLLFLCLALTGCWAPIREQILHSQLCANAVCNCEVDPGETIECDKCMSPDGTKIEGSCKLTG